MNVKYVLLVDLDEPDDDRAEAMNELPFDLEGFMGSDTSTIHRVERIEVETSDHLGDTVIIYYRRV
jgi:hypothetical protein